jgi:hypothetical protein
MLRNVRLIDCLHRIIVPSGNDRASIPPIMLGCQTPPETQQQGGTMRRMTSVIPGLTAYVISEAPVEVSCAHAGKRTCAPVGDQRIRRFLHIRQLSNSLTVGSSRAVDTRSPAIRVKLSLTAAPNPSTWPWLRYHCSRATRSSQSPSGAA